VNGIAVADNCDGIREIENRDLIPLGEHVEPAMLAARAYVLLKGVKVTDGRNRKGDRHGCNSKMSATKKRKHYFKLVVPQ
jgi:hypothetical protein